MTAEEIRAISNPDARQDDVPVFVILREIAAQLAEMNEREQRDLDEMVRNFAAMRDAAS